MASNRAVSPTSPMIVCTRPRDTKASPPASRTFSATRSTSASVASVFITTTIAFPPPSAGPGERKTPGRWPGVAAPLRRLADSYAGPGPP